MSPNLLAVTFTSVHTNTYTHTLSARLDSNFNQCQPVRTFFHFVIEFMRLIYLAAWKGFRNGLCVVNSCDNDDIKLRDSKASPLDTKSFYSELISK